MPSLPSTDELVTLGAPIALRDGSLVRIRQGHRSDRELLLRGFERLSRESRYRRFLAPLNELTESTVRYLTEIDHHDHDDWQRQGLGTLLLEVISARARQEGITRFTALMLASNKEIMDLLEELDRVRVVDRELGTVEAEVSIPPVGLSPALRKLIQIAAQHDVALPLAHRQHRRRRHAGDD